MSRNIVLEGWLTKSPPNKRIWRTKWRRRWFSLRQGELPGQYFLDYFVERNYRRLKGTIDLDLCEQVDAGLQMDRSGNGTIDPTLRGCVFTIQTHSRVYHLEADCEADMEKWVDAICRVCGLRSTDKTLEDKYHTGRSSMNFQFERKSGPYIHISECITGVRSQDKQRSFTFDSSTSLNRGSHRPLERACNTGDRPLYASSSQNRHDNSEISECDSKISDDELFNLRKSTSINDCQKSFNKLTIEKRNGFPPEEGPPVPPRPPKTLSMSSKFHVQKKQPDIVDSAMVHGHPSQKSQGSECTPPSPLPQPSCSFLAQGADDDDDDDDETPGATCMQYFNLPSLPLPPTVDRALKPRRSIQSVCSSQPNAQGKSQLSKQAQDTVREACLQYLDLDLPCNPGPSKPRESVGRLDGNHRKSLSATEDESAYKTVDFLKTEAFNITRQDAEASRSHQY